MDSCFYADGIWIYSRHTEFYGINSTYRFLWHRLADVDSLRIRTVSRFLPQCDPAYV